MLYAFFWVIPRRLNFICRRFGTLCLFHLHRGIGVEWPCLRNVGVFTGKKGLARTFSGHSTPIRLWRWNRQSVLKCRHIKFRRRGITQKKAYNMPVVLTMDNVNIIYHFTKENLKMWQTYSTWVMWKHEDNFDCEDKSISQSAYCDPVQTLLMLLSPTEQSWICKFTTLQFCEISVSCNGDAEDSSRHDTVSHGT